MKVNEIFIFARGGSKEIKNKNIINIKGKPLIKYTIDFARKLKIKNIFISTDCNKTKKICDKNKIITIDRPKNLATDTSPEIHSWKHAIKWYEIKYKKKIKIFISLPTTSPLRKKKDFEKAVILFNKLNCDLLVAIYKPNHYPTFNIVKKLNKDKIKIYDNVKKITNRQKVNNVFNISTCFYIAKRNYILKTNNLFSGNIAGIEVDEESAFDLDTRFQLKILKKII